MKKNLMDKLKLYETFLIDSINENSEKVLKISEWLKQTQNMSLIEKNNISYPIISKLEILQIAKDKLYELFPELKDYKI